MANSTTIKVSVATRDALRRLAERNGLAIEVQLDRMIRPERRRIIGAELASAPLDLSDTTVLNASASDARSLAGQRRLSSEGEEALALDLTFAVVDEELHCPSGACDDGNA